MSFDYSHKSRLTEVSVRRGTASSPSEYAVENKQCWVSTNAKYKLERQDIVIVSAV
jgi:hypothetical protein